MRRFNKEELLNVLKNQVEIIAEEVRKLQVLDSNILSKKPATDKWSVVECLEHLNKTSEVYLPQLNGGLENDSTMHASYRAGFIGNFFVKGILPKKEQVTFKMKTFAVLDPVDEISGSLTSDTVFDQFLTDQDDYLEIIERSRTADIKKPKIISAAGSILKLRFGDALRFVIAHEQRHLVQIRNTIALVNA